MKDKTINNPSRRAKNKNRKNAAVAVILIIALIAGIFAFLSATDTKTNVFTVGKVNVALREDDWYDENDHIKDDNNGNGVPDFAENVLPGEKVPKAPYVENTGSSPANIYLAVGMPIADWDEIYTGDGTYNGPAYPDIIIKTFGIQENYAKETDGEKIWDTFINNTGIEKLLGTQTIDEKNRVQLFTTIGLNETDWIPMPVKSSYDPNATDVISYNVYQSADGHNYYLYKYNNANGTAVLDSHTVTPELFTHVTLFKEIGDSKEEPPKPYTVNYYVKKDVPGTRPAIPMSTNSNAVVSTLGTAKENVVATNVEHTDNLNNWVLEASELHQGNYTIGTLRTKNTYFKEGSIFDWMLGSIDGEHVNISETAAYSGMTVNSTTNLFAVNTDITDGQTPADFLAYSFRTDKNGNVYAELNGANFESPSFPASPTTIVVPQYVSLVNNVIQNGYMWYTHGMGNVPTFDTEISPYSNIRNLIPSGSVNIPVKVVNVQGRSDSGITPQNDVAAALVSVAKKLVISNGVTDIYYVGNYLGSTNYSVLEKINIPYTCKYLGGENLHDIGNCSYPSGLYRNKKLTSVILPNNLKSIAYDCFAGTGLSEISLPNSLEILGPQLFWDTNITSVTVPLNVKYIMSDTFRDIADVTFEGTNWNTIPVSGETSPTSFLGRPENMNLHFNCTLDEFKNSNAGKAYAFYTEKFNDLLSISFADVTLLRDSKQYCSICSRYYWPEITNCICDKGDVYYGDTTLVSVRNNNISSILIKDGTTEIYSNAFTKCKNLTSIIIPDSVTTIGEAAFSQCSNLESITLSNSIKRIENYTFSACTNLKNITIPNSVTSIGEHAFSNCTGLTSITIPDSVTKIESYAFYNCTNLENITIPNTVNEIGGYAFMYVNAEITISQNNYNSIIEKNPYAFESFNGSFNFT